MKRSPHRFLATALALAMACLAFAPQAGAGTLSLIPSPKAFGNVLVGKTSDSTVTLQNTGSATTVTGILVTGTNASQFSASSGCGTLPVIRDSGESCSVNVSFQPTNRGAMAATLTATSSGNSPDMTLQGTGTAPELPLPGAPVTLFFGSRPAGTASAAQTFTVSNTGDAPLMLVDVSISPSDDDEDWAIQPCSVGVALAPGAPQFMPAGQPALAQQAIDAIRAWINSL